LDPSAALGPAAGSAASPASSAPRQGHFRHDLGHHMTCLPYSARMCSTQRQRDWCTAGASGGGSRLRCGERSALPRTTRPPRGYWRAAHERPAGSLTFAYDPSRQPWRMLGKFSVSGAGAGGGGAAADWGGVCPRLKVEWPRTGAVITDAHPVMSFKAVGWDAGLQGYLEARRGWSAGGSTAAAAGLNGARGRPAGGIPPPAA